MTALYKELWWRLLHIPKTLIFYGHFGNMQGEQMLTGPIVNERKILLYGGKGLELSFIIIQSEETHTKNSPTLREKGTEIVPPGALFHCR